MSDSSPPNKRKRPQRRCVAMAKKKKQLTEELYVCEMLEEVHMILSGASHSGDDNNVRALLSSISTFLETRQSVVAHAQSVHGLQSSDNEHKDPEDDPDNGIDINDEDSWSDELSEHSSDRDFIAASDDEGSYVPSEDEEEEEYVDSTHSDE